MQTRSLTFQIAVKCIKVQAKGERTSWAALFDACSAWKVLREPSRVRSQASS